MKFRVSDEHKHRLKRSEQINPDELAQIDGGLMQVWEPWECVCRSQ